MLHDFALSKGLLPLPVDHSLKLNDVAPSLQSRYRTFLTTTRDSAPEPRFGTLTLAGRLLESLPWHRCAGYASQCTSRCITQNSGPSGSLIFPRRTLSFPTSSRFIPAHWSDFFQPQTELPQQLPQSPDTQLETSLVQQLALQLLEGVIWLGLDSRAQLAQYLRRDPSRPPLTTDHTLHR